MREGGYDYSAGSGGGFREFTVPTPRGGLRTWVSAADAERLLDGGPGPAEVRRLLAAASAPGSAEELAGERAAVAAFARAAAGAAEPGRSRLRGAFARASDLVAAKTIATAFVLVGTASGGLALAASESSSPGDTPTVTPDRAESPTWTGVADNTAGAVGAARAALSAAMAPPPTPAPASPDPGRGSTHGRDVVSDMCEVAGQFGQSRAERECRSELNGYRSVFDVIGESRDRPDTPGQDRRTRRGS